MQSALWETVSRALSGITAVKIRAIEDGYPELIGLPDSFSPGVSGLSENDSCSLADILLSARKGTF